MANEKNEEFKNVSIEDVTKKLAEKRTEILEAFAKAYLAETGLLPSQVELVTQQMPMNDQRVIEHIYYFRRKA